MARRITLRDIAAQCGCTAMTVSYALRNHPSIPLRTRKKIQAVAKAMDYTPDPVLSALAAYRRVEHPAPAAAPLAWISNYETRDGWRKTRAYITEYLEGATERARQIGYRVESFWLREPGMTPERLSRVLYTRGIQGLLLPPQPRSRAHLNLDWSKFSSVTFGYSLARPRLHMTTTNQYRSTILIERKLRSLGYRRIGLALDAAADLRTDRNYHAAHLIEQLRFKKADRIPALYAHLFSPKAILKWVKDHRPDVILTSHPQEIEEVLRREGILAPRDIGICCIFGVPQPLGRYSGIDEHFSEVGAAAVDFLVSLLQRSERGIPAVPRSVLIDCDWYPGQTVRRVVGSAVKAA